MKFKKVLKVKKIATTEEKPVKKSAPKEKAPSQLASDEYKPMFEPIRIFVREYPSYKNPEKKIRDYVEFSIKRFDDDEAMAMCFCTMYRESELYTGYLKGKTIHFPIGKLADVEEVLSQLEEKCAEEGIEY